MISGQINLPQENLGKTLFNKVGRNPELAESSRMVLSYADKIYSLGNELDGAVQPAFYTADGF
jgi:LysR family transcriptional activator of nhaA